MTQLLVSVRNAAEAEAALAGGAHLIDVKEPSRGSLGRADDAILAEVLRVVAGRQPVSAARGELKQTRGLAVPPFADQLVFVKWGLSNYSDDRRTMWAEHAAETRRWKQGNPRCQVVTVAYADARRAKAQTVEHIARQLFARRSGVLLIDTFEKDERTLLDWLNVTQLAQICERSRRCGVRVALAGSLGEKDLALLRPLRPDWFAVRGAACQGRQRNAAIDAGCVRHLVELIAK